jgi:hypothetical protein
MSHEIGTQPLYRFRRNRRAFAFARPCQGDRRAVQSGRFLDRTSVDAEPVVADIFSSTIREYSAGEHLPRAIIRLRCAIVSHEAKASSDIITGSELGFRRRRRFIARMFRQLVRGSHRHLRCQ